ncbi:RDD family protein [Paraneptunicella aestuarii]|nr:RDD family protein [Paraneptunicella aestuarii]
MSLVGLLTYFNEHILLGVLAWFCFVSSKRPRFQNKATRRKLLRGTGYFLAFAFVLGTIETIVQNLDAFSSDKLSQIKQQVQQELESEEKTQQAQTTESVAKSESVVDVKSIEQALKKRLAEKQINQEDKQTEAGAENAENTGNAENTESKDLTFYLDGEGMRIRPVDTDGNIIKTGNSSDNENKDAKQPPSLLDWIQGLLADLGISFGWAAAYYSFTTAWYHGQTPGKRLVGIKVIKLDGSELTLWEAFGRYGGYGAGLATGLLGFIQIFWDANRQAIQDKISETLVIISPKVE